jgi:hypothetical protein
MRNVRMLLSSISILLALAAVARAEAPVAPADQPPPAAAGDRQRCFAELARFTWDRDGGESPVAKGLAYVEALSACDPLLAVAVERGAEFKVHDREAKIFARQKKFVIGAYAVLFGVLVVFVVVLFLRQQKLRATIEELETRLRADASKAASS